MRAETILDECEFKVLNAIHLKRLADGTQLAALTGLDTSALAPVLAAAAVREWVLSLEHGHMLLPAGTDAVRAYYDNCYAALRADATLDAWYARFEVLNTRFIALVTAWQQQSDEDALFKALEVVEQLTRELDRLLPHIPRYAEYQRRFTAALDAIDTGDTDLLCNPRRDSAHNIWFEFHEDILSVLGRPRDTT
jgi:hypothetical protein